MIDDTDLEPSETMSFELLVAPNTTFGATINQDIVIGATDTPVLALFSGLTDWGTSNVARTRNTTTRCHPALALAGGFQLIFTTRLF